MIWTLMNLAIAGPPAVEAVKYQPPLCDAFEDRPETSRRLARLRAQDQRERSRGGRSLAEHDAERVAAVSELAEQRRICTPEDHFFAAVVLQRGTTAEDQLRAHMFAFYALANGIRRAEQLTAVTYDGWRVSRGEPQWYGTQTGTDVQGRPCLIEIDPEATDTERVAVGLPRITEIVPRSQEARRGDPATPGMNGMYCPAVPWNRPVSTAAF